MGLLDIFFGKDEQTTSIPDWIKQPIQNNINTATNIAGMGYMPYYGPDVAAFTPMQEAAMKNTNAAASAFGMAAPANPMAGMPKAQNFGGVRGYSSAPMFNQAVNALAKNNPTQYAQLQAILEGFRKQAQPMQGGAANPLDPANAKSLAEYLRLGGDPSKITPGMFGNTGDDRSYSGPPHSGGSGGITIGSDLFGGNSWGSGSSGGGYTSILDRIDGGGPGAGWSSWFSGGSNDSKKK